MLEWAARQEHQAALAALAAASQGAKQDVAQMHEARQRLAWRTHRWRLAQLRRAAVEVKLIIIILTLKKSNHEDHNQYYIQGLLGNA